MPRPGAVLDNRFGPGTGRPLTPLQENYAGQRAARAALRDVYREAAAQRATRAPWSPGGWGARAAPRPCRDLSTCPQSFTEHLAQRGATLTYDAPAWSPIG